MTDHKRRLMRIAIMKNLAKEASEMTRKQLEEAFVKCKFSKISIFTLPTKFIADWRDIK